jgi:hypothetical protein
VAVISCVDYEGRRVTLSEKTWEDHLQARHPEMRGQDRAIETTIVRPDQANHAPGFADREVLYRKGVLPPPDKNDYVKVIVQYHDYGGGQMVGFVVTAFAVEEISSGEHIKWIAPR